MSDDLNIHLHLKETRERMFCWAENELPEKDIIVSIDQEIASIAEYRIKREIQSWLQDTNNCDLSEYMTKNFQKECTVVENDCIEIDNLILGRPLDPDGYNLGLQTATPGDTIDGIIKILPKSKVGKLLLFTTLLPLSPFYLLQGILVAPALVFTKAKESFQHSTKVKNYLKDKNKYANELANKMIENVCKDTIIDKVFQHFLKEIYEQVDLFCEVTVPKRINTGEILLKRIENDLRLPIDVRKQCFQLVTSSNAIYGRVLHTFMIFFNMFVIKHSEIKRLEGNKNIEVLVRDRWKPAFVKKFKCSVENHLDCTKLSNIYRLR